MTLPPTEVSKIKFCFHQKLNWLFENPYGSCSGNKCFEIDIDCFVLDRKLIYLRNLDVSVTMINRISTLSLWLSRFCKKQSTNSVDIYCYKRIFMMYVYIYMDLTFRMLSNTHLTMYISVVCILLLTRLQQPWYNYRLITKLKNWWS